VTERLVPIGLVLTAGAGRATIRHYADGSTLGYPARPRTRRNRPACLDADGKVFTPEAQCEHANVSGPWIDRRCDNTATAFRDGKWCCRVHSRLKWVAARTRG
jgi:hypothetical protein